MKGSMVVCPFCGCGCSFHLEERGGRTVGVHPSQGHPVSRGALCIKGWKAHEFVNRAERLRSPVIRDGGITRDAPWEEALDVAAEKLTEIRERYGSDSLGFLASAKVSNEENYLFMKMARAAFGTNNVDHCARL